jgi:hypothetical protein
MVISIEERVINHMDCNVLLRVPEQHTPLIRNVAECISQIVQTQHYPQEYFEGLKNMIYWEILNLRRGLRCLPRLYTFAF